MASVIKSVDSLCPGMIVDKEVSSRGTVLLKAGTPVSEAHIRQMRKWNITTVSIFDHVASPAEMAAVGAMQSDEAFLQEKARIENLFATLGEDKQMLFLKTCVLKHLEGH